MQLPCLPQPRRAGDVDRAQAILIHEPDQQIRAHQLARVLDCPDPILVPIRMYSFAA